MLLHEMMLAPQVVLGKRVSPGVASPVKQLKALADATQAEIK